MAEKATAFYLIENLTRQFDSLKLEEFEHDALYRQWQLKVSLALAQQLAMISQHLKDLSQRQQ